MSNKIESKSLGGKWKVQSLPRGKGSNPMEYVFWVGTSDDKHGQQFFVDKGKVYDLYKKKLPSGIGDKAEKFALDFAKANMNESYKIHYPSLSKLSSLQYTDPRVNTEGKRICAEKEGNFKKGDSNIHGHYVVYEDEGMPGSYIGVHIGSEINEDSGEAPINVVAIDTNRRAVVNRVAYRLRASQVAESEDGGLQELFDRRADKRRPLNEATFGKVNVGDTFAVKNDPVKKRLVKTSKRGYNDGDKDYDMHHDQEVTNEEAKPPKSKSIIGKGNAVNAHFKALHQALRDYKGKPKQISTLFHRVEGGPHGTYTVRSDDNGGKITTWIVFADHDAANSHYWR